MRNHTIKFMLIALLVGVIVVIAVSLWVVFMVVSHCAILQNKACFSYHTSNLILVNTCGCANKNYFMFTAVLFLLTIGLYCSSYWQELGLMLDILLRC